MFYYAVEKKLNYQFVSSSRLVHYSSDILNLTVITLYRFVCYPVLRGEHVLVCEYKFPRNIFSYELFAESKQ